MADTPRQVLENYKEKIIHAFIESLEKNDKVARGLLQQSIGVEIKAFATKFTIQIEMSKYWKYVDEGVAGYESGKGKYKFKKGGKPIPEDAMLKFIASRGLQPRMSNIAKHRTLKKLKNKTVKKAFKQKMLSSFAWALGKSLKKKGIKGTNFVNEALESGVMTQLQNDISEALGREIIIDLNLK